jgi:2-polyprenyl-6-methoxyphenol hydroxylase-like FAD-dependent oxidoreductase
MIDRTTSQHPSSYRSHAVVIGASMAGLLTARVLAETYRRVTVLDRDDLPECPAPRPGVPQGRHTHGLLARGREVIEALFPGMTADLLRQGAVSADVQEDCRWFHGERMLAQAPSGMMALAASRPMLECYLRQAISAWPQVTVHDGVSVLDLVFDGLGRRVIGVRVDSHDPDGPQGEMFADLVVDASGRTSRMPAWLARRGYEAPVEDKVRVDVSYSTRTFRRRPQDLDGDVAVVVAATRDNPRAAMMIALEGHRWTASLCGYHGERPPTDLPGFLAYAGRLPDPTVAELLRTSEPLDDGATYRFAANVRRRFEQMSDFPRGLLVLGDALCSFDPVFGQGMTTAALEAFELQRCLRQGTDDLAPRFFHAAAAIVDIPWAIVVGGDLDLPATEGERSMQTRLTNAYVRQVLRGGHHDSVLARAYLEVANLKSKPESLLAPGMLARVVRSRMGGHRRPAVEGAAGLVRRAA